MLDRQGSECSFSESVPWVTHPDPLAAEKNPSSLMKKLLLFPLLIGLIAQTAMAVATNPVGYSTQKIYEGVFNLVGITLQGTTVAAGAAVSVNGAVVTVADGIADGLGSGSYIFEVTSGTQNGVIDFIFASDSALNTLTLFNTISGLAATDTFVIRNAPTLGTLFGAGAGVLINEGDANTGDLVYVPSTNGTFDVYYHSENSIFGDGEWIKIGPGGDGANTPILYTSAVYVLNRSNVDYDLVITGEVKVTPSLIKLTEAFNYVSAVYPVGTTLTNSGIADSVGFLKGDANTGDLVYISDSVNHGSFRIFYHSENSIFGDGAWTEIGGLGGDGSVALSSGIVILRRAPEYSAGLNVPSSWNLNN